AASPRRAKVADRCCWRAASTLTANAPCALIASSVTLGRSKQTRTSGGSSDSEVTALAVVPTGSPFGPTDVTMVTPVANWPMACRKSAAATSRRAGSVVVAGAPKTPALLLSRQTSQNHPQTLAELLRHFPI